MVPHDKGEAEAPDYYLGESRLIANWRCEGAVQPDLRRGGEEQALEFLSRGHHHEH